MKKTLFLPFAFILFLSCGTNENQNLTKEAIPEVTTEHTVTAIEPGCYAFDDGKSTVIFEIVETGDVVKGNLTYRLSEKDANVGAFKGKQSGDKLIGTYEFGSEGVTSSREIAFMVKGDELIEGYGEMNETGDAFKDKNSLSYDSSMPLKKGECVK